jgi:6,7-dimethyl-8-ribityllumazine synthase
MSYRFAIVASQYNSVIMDRLIGGAQRALKDQKQVIVIRVPGSFEIPLAASAVVEATMVWPRPIVGVNAALRLHQPAGERRAAWRCVGNRVPVGFGARWMVRSHGSRAIGKRSSEAGSDRARDDQCPAEI